jgi:hypothetical protein
MQASVEHVPLIFFLEVRRHRTTPFWRRQTLKVTLEQNHIDEGGSETVDGEYDDDTGGMSEKEEPEVEEVVEARGEESTFEEAINANIDFLQDQILFRDQRMLKTLKREGAEFLRFAKACKEDCNRRGEDKHPRRGRSQQSRRCSTALVDPRMPK